jgi:hypothetical protein
MNIDKNPNWHCLMCGLEPIQTEKRCPVCHGPLVRYRPKDADAAGVSAPPNEGADAA